MAVDKKAFLKKVIVLCDTAEQENEHIKKALDKYNVKHEDRNLDFGDYSFIVEDKDFSGLCVIERKADVDEFYGNITHDRGRIEREFGFASKTAKDFTLIIEKVSSLDEIKETTVPKWQMERLNRTVSDIGKLAYCTIQSWQRGNKYQFNLVCVKDCEETAGKMLEIFYYFWRNYKELSANRRLKNT